MLRPGAVHRANGGYLMLPAAEVLVTAARVAEAQGGAADRPHPAREPGRGIRADPDQHVDAGDDRARSEGRARRPAAALRARVFARRGRPQAVPRQGGVRLACAVGRGRRRAGTPGSSARRSALPGCVTSTPSAVARIVEHGARLAENREWLSTSFVEIAGLASEASHWAAQDGARRSSAPSTSSRRSSTRSGART